VGFRKIEPFVPKREQTRGVIIGKEVFGLDSK
jgi:hypothetical protein